MTPPSPIVVSFHTRDPHYTALAAAMAASVVRAGLSLAVAAVTVPDGESWAGVCALKAGHVADCLRRFDKPVMWLDADAEIVGDVSKIPWLLGDADLAVYAPGLPEAPSRFPRVNSNLLSGTMIWAQTERAHLLASAWRANADRTRYDQETLFDLIQHRAVRDLKVAQLDPRYVCVPDLMPGVEPVVLHRQASRTQTARVA